mgnify:FL=1|tara:strand:- start:383 stop:781 length:399 start_codon:yes stop_codon:yes gene_type:complete
MDENSRRKNSPYCSRANLERIKNSAYADALPIEEHMLLWTPTEAKEYFESKGNTAPDPQLVATRSLDDQLPPSDPTGPKKAKQELIFTLMCPCCDMIITDQMDRRDKRAEKKKQMAELEVGGAPPAAQAISR